MMNNNSILTIASVVALVALVGTIAIQILEMKSYSMF